jgi:hypothetical protein
MCANSINASRAACVCDLPSQLRSPISVALNSIAIDAAVLVPSLGAQLRSSAHRSTCRASSFATHRRSVVRPETSPQLLARRCRSAALPNNALVPTRKGDAPLLAAQRGRWAAEGNMSSERNRNRHQRHENRGANIAPALSIAAVYDVASQLRSTRAAFRRRIAVVPPVVVPSLGAQLRSSPHQKVACIKAQRALPCSRIAVLSQASWSRPSASVQSGSLPNKRVNHARTARSTRKVQCTLLAGYAGRYVAKS